MVKNCLRQLEAAINSFNFYQKRFFLNHSIRRCDQNYDFLREIAHPLLARKVNIRQKIFHGYLPWNWLYQ